MRRTAFALALVVAAVAAPRATSCTPTGFFRDSINMTAALINSGDVTGVVNATGCNIGVYYGPGAGGRVHDAEVFGANYFGVVVNGDAGAVSADVLDSWIHDIGESPLNGSQHGVAIYYRATGPTAGASGKISGNTIERYQKGGIVANFEGTSVIVSNNTVTGLGPVNFIAQNGIQIGYGASANVMKNTVTGNSYTGTSTVSGGIIVVGGPYYGEAYTTNTKIVQNTVRNNDIGIFLTNIAADGGAPATATNVKATNNIVSSDGLHNNYGGFGYQAGISDVGNNDKMIANTISGPGYDPAANPGAYTVAIDADVSFTNRPKVHANK